MRPSMLHGLLCLAAPLLVCLLFALLCFALLGTRPRVCFALLGFPWVLAMQWGRDAPITLALAMQWGRDAPVTLAFHWVCYMLLLSS